MLSNSNIVKSSFDSPILKSSYFTKKPKPPLHSYKPMSLTCYDNKLAAVSTFSTDLFNTFKSKEFHIEIFKLGASLFGLVFTFGAKLCTVGDSYNEGDLIELPRNGVPTLAYVKRASLFVTTFQTHSAYFTLTNNNIDTTNISNLTLNIGTTKYFAIQEEFDPGSNDPRELFDKIEAAITRNDYVNEYMQQNIIALLPNKKISVCCYVRFSMLGATPFNTYLKARREVILDIAAVINADSHLFGFLNFLPSFRKSLKQPLSRGSPLGIVASPLSKQRITYRNLIRWDFLVVNDLITTQVNGTEIFGFVVSKGWFGLTIKLKNGKLLFSSKGKSNGVLIKFDHQTKNGDPVNWRFTTELKVEIDHFDRIEKEIYKIIEEDKDLEQEDAFVFLTDIDWSNRKAVCLVSCFTKTATHEDYFTIRDALLLKLHKLLIDTNS